MARKGENIYKRKDGRWEGRYKKSNNPSKYGYVYAKSYTEVKSKLLIAKMDYERLAAKETFRKEKYNCWLDKWLLDKRRYVKESTYIRYRNIIENHIKPLLGDYDVNEIDCNIIQQFIDQKMDNGKINGLGGLSPKSLYDILLIIKESFKYINELNTSVCFDGGSITIKKDFHKMRVLSLSEERKLNSILLTDINRYKLGILICLYTGIRIGELCALKWGNISFEDKMIRIDSTMQRIQCENQSKKTKIIITDPKSTSSTRIIPIPDFLFSIIQSFSSLPDAFILTGTNDRFIEPRTMQNHFKKYLELGGIQKANFHALRHTFATRCVESEFDIKALSEILGHSSVKVTLDRYVHTTLKLKKDNMEKLRLAI